MQASDNRVSITKFRIAFSQEIGSQVQEADIHHIRRYKNAHSSQTAATLTDTLDTL